MNRANRWSGDIARDQQILDEIQTQFEDRNFKPGGMRPFGSASECVEATFYVEAGFNGTKAVHHNLVSRSGVHVVPNRWLVVDMDQNVTVYRDVDSSWGIGLVAFKVSSTNAATVTVVLWRAS